MKVSVIYILGLSVFWFLSCGKNADPSVGNIEKLYPYEDHYLMKQFPEKSFPIRAYERALQRVAEFSARGDQRLAGQWVVQGPGNLGARINTIAVHPQNENIILIGYSEGGLWRTENGGKDWTPVFDDKLALSIGDIEFDPVNPDIVFAGTGDPNISGYPFVGNGLYKSTDAGNSWSFAGLAEARIISQIRISKQNPSIMYVAAMGLPFEKNIHRGLYKTLNGGQSWQQVLFVNDSTGIIDIALHPSNPDIVYACAWNRIRNNATSLVSGPDAKIYKTTDGGLSWNMLSNGLPQDPQSRIGITIYEAEPETLYACYTRASDFNLLGIYKTTNGGDAWTEIPTAESNGLSAGNYGGFGWYFGKIRVNPSNPDDLFILGVDLYRTRNGGQNWEIATPPWWQYDVHADKHDLVWLKDHILLATDGGLYKSRRNNTEEWEDIENIPATQFYRVGYNPNYPELYYGGAQDNGTSGGNAETINDWLRIFGGDGFQPLFHPTNPDIYYVSTQNGGLAVTTNGGLNFQGARDGINSADPRNWDMPFMMSHHNPAVLYTGTHRVYKSTREGVPAWSPISEVLTNPNSNAFRKNISTLHESPVNPDILYAGTSDGWVWTSKNGGQSWQPITNGLPHRYVSSVVASHHDENVVFVSFTGYKDNDFTPYIYRSDNGGLTWRPVQGNLPSIAVNNILLLPPVDALTNSKDDIIFAATDGGVFWTKDGGISWQRLGSNMPVIPVYDIEYNVANHEIIAGTFARSIQSFDLRQIDLISSVRPADKFPAVISVNPAVTQGIITVICNTENTLVNYTITDVNGTPKLSGKAATKSWDLDVSFLPAGIYFMQIRGDRDVRFTRQFVKM